MTIELSEDLSRILEQSRNEATRLHLSVVDSSCLVLGLLRYEQSRTLSLLRADGIDTTALFHSTEAEALQQGSAAISATTPEVFFSMDVRRILRLSLLEARLEGKRVADEPHLVLAMLRDKDNAGRRILNGAGLTYTKVVDALGIKQQQPSAGFSLADDQAEQPPFGNSGAQGPTATTAEQPKSDTPITDSFGTDLTRLAARNALDPVVGRESEIMRIAQILCRRKKNNPILIGEPGVGKSAIVEGLASLIARHQVPRLLRDKRIVALDMASIVAGTQYRGQFEERLKRLLEELRAHREIILFIDEIHTMIGAGSAAGSLDAANILKPALARGEVQCIGATTTDEYRKTIEKDGALERRFQHILLEPTSPEETLQILHNIKGRYEEHHFVSYTDEALEACVRLSDRYITDRALPDKAIDALDEAGSRKHLLNLHTPKDIEQLEQQVEAVRQQKTEAATAQNYELAANLRDEVARLEQELRQRNEEWLQQQNSNRQAIDADDVASVISAMSGVPVQRVAQDETAQLRGMQQALSAKVIAQDEAISRLVRAITRNRLGLKGHDRPVGTFLFVGPTGVGKTYLVKTLAEWMFGRKDALIRIDMSEYGEKYSTSRLVGAPPGYVGYEEGGQLTEKVRRHPYSVILLDEIEKAHPDVFNTLLQVMDEGRMTDGNGATVDFRNTIIIMTSNSGTRQLKDFGQGIGFKSAGETAQNAAQAESIIRKALNKQFAPEFLNRLDDIVVFQSLQPADAQRIADLELDALRQRLQETGFQLELTPEAKAHLVDLGFDAQYGARSLKRIIQTHVEDRIADLLLEQDAPDASGGTIRFTLADGNLEATLDAPKEPQA